MKKKPFKAAVIKLDGKGLKFLEKKVNDFTSREVPSITEADERLLKASFLKLYKEYPEIIAFFGKDLQNEEMVNDAVSRFPIEKIDDMAYANQLDIDKINPKMLPLLLNCKNEKIKNLITSHLKNIK